MATHDYSRGLTSTASNKERFKKPKFSFTRISPAVEPQYSQYSFWVWLFVLIFWVAKVFVSGHDAALGNSGFPVLEIVVVVGIGVATLLAVLVARQNRM